jgi:hypothetical protein
MRAIDFPGAMPTRPVTSAGLGGPPSARLGGMMDAARIMGIRARELGVYDS